MIGKTSIGSSFGGCVRYQFEGHKHSLEQKQAEILEAVGVRMNSASSMTADFNRGRLLNPDLGRAVWHTSVSFNPDDRAKMTNEKMLAVAQDYVRGMGLDQTQYVIIRHHDQPHPHFHLIANRVDNSGQTISDSHNYARSQALLKELSIKHELTPVAQRRVQRQRPDQLQGADLSRHQIRQTLEQVLTSCASGPAFAQRVQAQGITYQVRQNEAGQAVGVSFAKDGYTFKGSDIARSYSYAGITKQLETNYRQQQQLAQAQKQAAEAIKVVEPVSRVVQTLAPSEGPKKGLVLSDVERKWQEEYQQLVHRFNQWNEQIRATNAWIEEAAQQLAQTPTLKTAQALKQACPDYGLSQVLDKQIKEWQSYQFNVTWRAEQRQLLSRQAGSWFGLSNEAREAKAKLAYLDNPDGAGSDYQMKEKHYEFWIHARHGPKAKPEFGFAARSHQKEEHTAISLSQYAKQQEEAQKQELAQQERLRQYRSQGPKLGGGRGMG